MHLTIPLSSDGEPLFRQVYSGIRHAILSGTMRAGDRLPSTRDLAERLRISRTVVLLAYETADGGGVHRGTRRIGDVCVGRNGGQCGFRGNERRRGCACHGWAM